MAQETERAEVALDAEAKAAAAPAAHEQKILCNKYCSHCVIKKSIIHSISYQNFQSPSPSSFASSCAL
jgi:hypothetical protein